MEWIPGCFSTVYVPIRSNEDMQPKIRVNSIVAGNELGGRDVRAMPSWKKIWNRVKKASLRPIMRLTTERFMLNAVRKYGAYICEMCEH